MQPLFCLRGRKTLGCPLQFYYLPVGGALHPPPPTTSPSFLSILPPRWGPHPHTHPCWDGSRPLALGFDPLSLLGWSWDSPDRAKPKPPLPSSNQGTSLAGSGGEQPLGHLNPAYPGPGLSSTPEPSGRHILHVGFGANQRPSWRPAMTSWLRHFPDKCLNLSMPVFTSVKWA